MTKPRPASVRCPSGVHQILGVRAEGVQRLNQLLMNETINLQNTVIVAARINHTQPASAEIQLMMGHHVHM